MIRTVAAGFPDAPASARPQLTPQPVSIDDWDLLFRAVLTRLTQAVEQAPDAELQARVADCAQALEQLRLSMVAEFARRDRAAD